MAQLPQSGDGALLDSLLNPLLHEFDTSFRRGLQLLEHCPESLLREPSRRDLRQRLQRAQAELRAAHALRAAAPAPMALDMAVIAPWHRLLLEVWSLSATLRAAGISPDPTSAAP